MSQIRAKQIKLVNQGDLIVADSLANGSVLPIGTVGQHLEVTGSSVNWEWSQQLYDPNGVLVVDTGISTGGVNYITFTAGTPGNGPTIAAIGPDTNIDLNLTPVGLGEILAPVGYTANIVSENALITKGYVDNSIAGLDWKDSALVATSNASEVSAFTYVPANEPNGNVWTGVVAPVIDGVTLADGDRILIKNASDPRGNGLFIYDATNSVFIRTSDANNTPNNEVSNGLAVFIESGSSNAGSAWVLTSPVGVATLGTDNLTFTQFAGTTLYAAGSGLTLTGSTFSVNQSSTIGIVADNVVVQSNSVSGNVLISTGVSGQEAVWGALDLSNPNSVTGSLTVVNGGTGLSAVPAGAILIGGTTSSLAFVSAGPTSSANTVYVLQGTGSAPTYGPLTLNQLADVSSASAIDGSLLVYNSATGQWEPSNLSALDKLVRVTVTDTDSGYLADKLKAGTSGAVTFVVGSAGVDETYYLSVNRDGLTIQEFNNRLGVGGGSAGQTLFSTGASTVATWGWVSTLYNSSGDVIVTVTGSGSTMNINATSSGVTVSSNTNLYLTATSSVYIAGTLFPTSAPERSVLVANTDNVLEYLTASPSANQVLRWNVSTSAFEFIPQTDVGGFAFALIEVSGNGNGVDVSATTTNDTLSLVGGAGIALNGSTKQIVISMTASGVPTATPSADSVFTFFNGGTLSQTSLSSLFAATNVVYGVSGTGIIVQTASGVYEARSIVADTANDRLGISVVFGDGVSGNPTIGLNIAGLSATSTLSPSSALFVFYNVDTGVNESITLDNAISTLGLGTVAWASANAVSAVNESFTGFFAFAPVADSNITIYFNGLALKSSGWTRSGTTLTLVDAQNGYGTQVGDVITASYQY